MITSRAVTDRQATGAGVREAHTLLPINLPKIWWLMSALAVLGALVWLPASALAQNNTTEPAQPATDPPALQTPPVNQQSNQLFQGDLRVERGQVISGDTVVYDGDVRIAPEGQITGNLVVFRGDVLLESGGAINGNLDLFSGDAELAGTVDGNVALWAGDITLRNSAHVGGNVSVLAGDINRDPNAFVGGNVVVGPNFNMTPPVPPRVFGFDFGGGQPAATTASRPLSLLQWVGAFLARLLGAVLMTAFVAVLIGLAVHVRPNTITRVQRQLQAKPAASFVIGLSVNLILVFLGGLLAITVCLLPIALVPMLALLAINLVGWAALAQWVGRRAVSAVERPLEEWATAAIGAVLITSVFALLWAFGGFFRFLGNSALLFTASFGAGAVLYPWVMRILQPERNRTAMGSGAAGTATVTAIVPQEEAPTLPSAQSVRTFDAPVRPESAPGATSVEKEPDAASESGDSAIREEDDFTELRGVGPVLDGRLKDAGIRTFVQLAASTPAEIAEIIGWNEERVTRTEIIEQAQNHSSNSSV